MGQRLPESTLNAFQKLFSLLLKILEHVVTGRSRGEKADLCLCGEILCKIHCFIHGSCFIQLDAILCLLQRIADAGAAAGEENHMFHFGRMDFLGEFGKIIVTALSSQNDLKEAVAQRSEE